MKYLAKFFTWLFFGLFLFLLYVSFFQKDWIILGIEWVEKQVNMLGNWNYLVIFLSSMIESFPFIGTTLPGTNIMLIVGGIFGKNHFLFSFLLAGIGACIGNFFGYFLGKKYGQQFVEDYGHYFGIGLTEIKYLTPSIQKNGFWFILLGKFHNFLRAFIPFIAGIGKMSPRSFWIYNIIGSFIWSAVMLFIGKYFFENYEIILENIGKILSLFVFGFLGYILLFHREKFMEYMKEKNAELEQKIEKKN